MGGGRGAGGGGKGGGPSMVVVSSAVAASPLGVYNGPVSALWSGVGWVSCGAAGPAKGWPTAWVGGCVVWSGVAVWCARWGGEWLCACAS